MFDYVSGANYFGETLEWVGYAIACWNLQAASFAIFVMMFLGSRALQHHKYANIINHYSCSCEIKKGLRSKEGDVSYVYYCMW